MSRARRIFLAISTLLVLGAGAILWTAPTWLVDALASRYPGCIYRLRGEERVLALTLDDGPDSLTTPLILAELRRHRARATFFLVAGRARTQDSLVRAIVADGHEIGNHFTHDRPSIRLSPQEFAEDLRRAHRTLARFGRLRWARPASGWYTSSMVAEMERHGYRCALGSVYPFDAAIPSVTWATGYILRNARPGAIVILHDAGARGRRTARVLSEVLPRLRERGFRVTSLSDAARQ